jgi:hypothetical protein
MDPDLVRTLLVALVKAPPAQRRAGVVGRWWMHPILRTLLQWLRQLHPASFVQLMSLSP